MSILDCQQSQPRSYHKCAFTHIASLLQVYMKCPAQRYYYRLYEETKSVLTENTSITKSSKPHNISLWAATSKTVNVIH